MRLFSKSNVATIAIVTGIVVASGTGGAVAGAMITGKQIKDGTVTTADIKNSSLKGTDVKTGSLTGVDVKDGSIGTADLASSTRSQFLKIARPTHVIALSSSVPAGVTASTHVDCPPGQVAISGTATWNNTFKPAASYPANDNLTGWSSQSPNPSASSDAIYLSVICAKVG